MPDDPTPRDTPPPDPASPADPNASDPRSTPHDPPGTGLSRRSLLRAGALAGAAASVGGLAGGAEARPAVDELDETIGSIRLREATIAEMQAEMESGALTAFRLVNRYLRRIDRLDRARGGPRLRTVLEVNPDARDQARALDRERRESGPRSPLHGIPVLLKDNIDTGDRMQTAAGSLALVGAPALRDSTVAERLRAAGAVILGKAGLSEWANFRSFFSSSGWSARGGQVKNPYVLDRNPCGSSSGSAASVSANLAAAALGTETDGSIVCPSHACGVVGIKPTVGLTSRAGVVPISDTQDTVGPHGRTVGDAAAVLGALTGVDPRDAKTRASAGRSFTDYTQFLDADGLAGARIGVSRRFDGNSEEVDRIYQEAIDAMADAGAVIVDPAEIPTADALAADLAEIIVLIFEFKRDLNAYLATRPGVPISTLADAIAFDRDNADVEMPFFLQEIFLLAEGEIFSEQDYLDALERGPRLAGPEGIDAVLDDLGLDALVAPTGGPAWPIDLVSGDLAFNFGSSSPAAVAGYPLLTLPMGSTFGLPVGITFMGRAFDEPTLIRLASGFENATRARREPGFVPSLDLGEPPTGDFVPGRRLEGSSPRSAAASMRLERLAERVRARSPEIAVHLGLL